MRIAYLIEAWNPIYGGGQVHLKELTKRLSTRYNVDIDIYTRCLTVDDKNYFEDYKEGKINIYRRGLCSKYGSMLGRLSWTLSVAKEVLSKKYDIVHGQANIGGFPLWLVKKFSKSTPCIFTVHGSGLDVWNEMAHGFSQKINYFMEKLVQTQLKYDLEISVDSRFQKFKNVNKVIVIPNGVDIYDYCTYNTEKVKGKLLFVGRLHPQKGLKYLIEAVKLIKDKFKYKIYIVGSGELETELKDLIYTYDIVNYFVFVGSKFGTELVKEYKSAVAFVLPSVFEGQPLTILEAMASKLPCIVTDVGDNSLFVNTSTGWIVPSKDAKALAKVLLELDTADLDTMGKNGFELVSNNYTWDIMTEKYYDLYQQILGLK